MRRLLFFRCSEKLPHCFFSGINISIGSSCFSGYRSFHNSRRLTNAALSILSLLRQRGPIPVSKISSELSDEALEEASELGGIVEVLKRRSDVIIVTLKKSVHVAVLKDMVQHVDRQHKQGVTFLLAGVSALNNLPKIFSLNGVPLVPSIDSLYRMSVGEGYSKLFDSPDAVHRTIHRYPTLFRIERGGRVRLTLVSESMMSAADSMREQRVSSLTKVLTARQEMLLSALRKTVPESMYVSLKYWSSTSSGFWRSLQEADLIKRLQELQSTDPPRIDLRQFGTEFDHCFVRVLARQQDGFTVEEEEKKRVFERQKEYFVLGREMIKHLEVYKSASPENYLSMIKGMTMKQIGDIISPDFKQRILKFVYDEDIPLSVAKEESIILLFDRLRHIFDVRFSNGTVRLWNVLPSTEQPSTLTWETSPLPLVLRHVLKELSDTPQSPQHLYDRMPGVLQWELQQLYPTTGSDAVNGTTLGSVSNVSRTGDGSGSMRLFSSHHSMFLFLGEDGLFYTPQLVASQKKKKNANLTDNEKANIIFQLLPPSGAVDLMTFVGHDVGRELPFSSRTITETFVSRYPTFFRIYSPFASNRTVVGRVGVPPPPSDLLNPSFQCVEDLIKFIALHSVGGVTESTIMNNLSKEGRSLIKRVGTPTEIAEQLPMWFDVRRDKFNSGASLITYIPGSIEDTTKFQKYPALRLVSNDRSLDSHSEETNDEWNEEWNE